MNKLFSILIGIIIIASCKNKQTKQAIQIFKPLNNSVQFDYKESDNLIELKWIQSDEILFEYYYKMYSDDTLIERIKKHYTEKLNFERDTSKNDNTNVYSRTAFIKTWLKRQLINPINKRIFIEESYQSGEIASVYFNVEIEHENNSSYYLFQNDLTKPSLVLENYKKGYISNLFDTLVKYNNTKIDKERPLPWIIDDNNPEVVSKFEKNYITTARCLQFSNRRYKQIGYLSSRIDSIIYRKETGLDIDSISRINQVYIDSFRKANGE